MEGSLLKVFFLALRSLSVRKVQALLSTLGIVFAVTAVVMMLAITEGAKGQIMEQIAHLGTDTLIIRQLPLAPGQIGRRQEHQTAGLTPTDVSLIKANIVDLVQIAPLRKLRAEFSPGSENSPPQVLSTTTDYGRIKRLETVEGRFLCDEDGLRKNRVCIIGHNLAQAVVANRGRGDSILINQQPYLIIGILKEHKVVKNRHPALGGLDYNEVVLIPIEAEPPGPVTATGQDEFHEIHLQLSPGDNVYRAAAVIERLLVSSHRGYKDFQVIIPEALLRQAQATQRTFNVVLGCIASISLVVGGIGIMNIMLATVAERTREIGVKRALGATRADITREFLIEAMILTLVGGLIGLFTGAVGASIVAASTGWPVRISLWSVGIALATATGVGIFFGLYPARKAAFFDPIEALGYE